MSTDKNISVNVNAPLMLFLFVILVVVKYTVPAAANLSWWIVTMPLWIGLVILFGVLLIVAATYVVGLGVFAASDEFKARKRKKIRAAAVEKKRLANERRNKEHDSRGLY